MDEKKITSAKGTGSKNPPVDWVVNQRLPTGTVTFLFTDIEGSTPLWESQPELMEAALQIHNDILFKVIEEHEGRVFKMVGDEFQAAFATAPQALKAAVEIQLGLQNANWNPLGPLKVRMGLHTGEAHLDDIGDEYAVSHTKNRVGRIRSAAHGGQILLSQESADLCDTTLPEGMHLKPLGEFRMKGMSRREALFQVVVPGLAELFPPPATLTEPKHNLPRQLTPFVGREREVEQIKALMKSSSLVTLTGSGGVGKTRLSLRVAEDLVDDFADGVCFIELAALTEPKLVVQTVALALGVREETGRPFQEALESFLKTRQVLLVLDNCEHLIEACARLTDHLVRQCPLVRLLGSSREALGVTGERVYHVPSLAMPNTQEKIVPAKLTDYDAVALFLERGRAALASFQVTPDNAGHILSICQRLDGIPLALELAAARLNVLSTEQLASRLDHTFRLLVGGARTAVPRQQTLRATIDWSYQLLSEQERGVLRRLAVFVGGFSLEGAEAVVAVPAVAVQAAAGTAEAGESLEEADIFDILVSLVNKSMVNTDRVQGEKTRYHLLETVRQYAREKLFDAGESERLRDLHLAYYEGFVAQAEPQIHGAGRLEWTEQLKKEHANIREALEWAFKDSTQVLKGLRIATAITDRFWFTLNLREGETWLKRGLQMGEEIAPPDLLARAYYSLGRMMALEDRPKCLYYLNQCIDLSKKIAPAADRELALALCLSAEGLDAENALKRSEEGVQVARSLTPTDVWLLAECLYFRADVLLLCGRNEQALTAAQESIRCAEKGDRWMTGGNWIAGIVQIMQNQPEKSKKNLERGLELCLEVDDLFGVWYSLVYLVWQSVHTGQIQEAYSYCRDLLKMSDRLKMPLHFYDLGLMGIILALSGKQSADDSLPAAWPEAVRLLAAFEELGKPYVLTLAYENIRGTYQDWLKLIRERMDPKDFEAAWEEGMVLAGSLDGAVQYALEVGERYIGQEQIV
jgi:predicted ATPase/class 3 adenylate cyclase